MEQSTWHLLSKLPVPRPPNATLPLQFVTSRPSAAATGSFPVGQRLRLQSDPKYSLCCVWPLANPTSHDESQTQPYTLSSSQVVVSSAPVYVLAPDDKGKAPTSPAIRRIVTQRPWPEQSIPRSAKVDGHFSRWHASPVKLPKHLHLPVDRSQMPSFEHSARA